MKPTMPGSDPPLPPWLRAWDWLRALGRVLWLARFSVVFVAIGTVALLANDQAQEVLREFAARRSSLHDLLQIAILLLATLLWCWNAWSWARMLTSLRMPGTPEPDGTELALRITVPRVLGAVAAFAVPTAMWIAAAAYTEYAVPFAQQLRWVAAVMFAGAVAFVAYVVFRRRIRMFAVRRPADDAARGRLEWNELPAFDRATLWVTAGITVTLFTLFLVDAATTAPWFGSAPILLAALAAWIPFGSLLVWLSYRWHSAPLFSLFLLAAVVFGLWNDNRAIRTLAGTPVPHARGDDCDVPDGPQAARPAPRHPVCGYAKRWLQSRRDAIGRHVAEDGRAVPGVPRRRVRRRHPRRVLDGGPARIPARPRSEVHRADVRDQRRIRRQPRGHGLCRTGAREGRRPRAARVRRPLRRPARGRLRDADPVGGLPRTNGGGPAVFRPRRALLAGRGAARGPRARDGARLGEALGRRHARARRRMAVDVLRNAGRAPKARR